MTIQYINTGSSANAGNGDSLRSAFIKVNSNFNYLSTASFGGGGSNGYTGSRGSTGTNGYTGSAGNVGYWGSVGYTGSAGPGTLNFGGVGDVPIYLGGQLLGPAQGLSYTTTTNTLIVGRGQADANLYIQRNTYSNGFGAGFTFAQHHETADAVNFNFYRTRGTSTATAAVQNGDDIIDIGFFASDPSANIVGSAAISATVDGVPSTLNIPVRFSFFTNNGSGFAERARLSSTGVWEINQLSHLTGTSITVSTDLVPDQDSVRSLGSTSSQWRSLYVSSSTIYLGGVAVSIAGGNLTINGNPVSASTATGYTGSASTATGYTGSASTATGYTGSASTATGYTGSQGSTGTVGYTGSASTATGYTGSQGSTGTVGYTGSSGGAGSATTSTLVNGAYTVSLSTSGSLTLPAGGIIAEGGGLTGAIRLTPAGGANAYQALVIYPTANPDGDHLHLTAGGGATELYLGDDSRYVKLVNGGNVEIRATTTSSSASAAWTFGTNGAISTTDPLIINVPNGVPTGVGAIASSSGSWEQNPAANLATTGGSGTGLRVSVTHSGGYASAIAITVAGTGYLDGELITVTSGGSSASFIIAVTGTINWTFGTNGSLTFPNATVQTTAWTGTVAYSNITNVPSVSTSTLVSGTSTVTLSSTGKLTLSTAGIVRSGTDTAQVGYQAVFTQDLYGNTSTGQVSGMTLVDVGSNAQLLALIDPSSAFSNSQYNLLSPITITYSDATTQTFTNVRITNTSSGVIGFGYNATTIGHNFPITVTAANYVAATTAPEWTFGSNGSLTFPNSTIQTTAWTGIPGPYANDAAAAAANVAVGNPYHKTGTSGQVFVRLT